jgi:hypothetical protein
MQRFKTHMLSGLVEASIMKGDYVVGHKFVWKGTTIKEWLTAGYKAGDVFELVAQTDDAVLIGTEDGKLEKWMKGPDGKVWHVKGSDGFKATSFTHLKSSGSPPSGAQWEDVIVYAYNTQAGLSTDPETEKVALSFWEMYGESANKIAENFRTQLNAKRLIQTGRGIGKVTLGPHWKKAKAKNTTPKTDVASDDWNERISLKKSGGSQLASAGAAESVAIVSAALSDMGDDKGFAKDLVSSIEENMTKLISRDTVTSLKRRSKSGDTDPEVLDFEKKDNQNKELSAMLGDYINTNSAANTLFGKHVVLEAATGNNKFGSPTAHAAANILGKFDINTGKVEVEDIIDIKSPIIVKYASKVQVFVAFKKAGAQPAWAAMRMVLFESNRPLIEDTFQNVVLNKLSEVREFRSLMTESVLEEGIFDVLKRVGGAAKALGKDAVTKFANVVQAVVEKIKKILNKIMSMGKKMVSALMKFLGIDIDKVSGFDTEITL